MARRRKKRAIERCSIVALLAVLGLISFGRLNLHAIFERFASGVGQIILAVAAVAVAYLAMRIFLRRAAWRGLLRKVTARITLHQVTLVRRKWQLVRPDDYGKQQTKNWEKEIDRFIADQIVPYLSRNEKRSLDLHMREITEIVNNRLEVKSRAEPGFNTFSNDMTPTEFEILCADELPRSGWKARVTMQSRDQGVDVIAEKNGVRAVIQCKLYSRPVGNKSVQEVAAGRVHERAHHGVVVTNNGFTLAAKQLAFSNSVLLLHYRDLQNLESILSKNDGNRKALYRDQMEMRGDLIAARSMSLSKSRH